MNTKIAERERKSVYYFSEWVKKKERLVDRFSESLCDVSDLQAQRDKYRHHIECTLTRWQVLCRLWLNTQPRILSLSTLSLMVEQGRWSKSLHQKEPISFNR